MSNTKKTANNKVSNNRIIIIKLLTFSDMDVQLDNIAIGVIIVVNNTKYIDSPSTPKYKWNSLKLWYSWTNWNWLVEKSNIMNINKDNIKLKVLVINPIDLIFWLFKPLDNIENIPNNGISNKLVINMKQKFVQGILLYGYYY